MEETKRHMERFDTYREAIEYRNLQIELLFIVETTGGFWVTNNKKAAKMEKEGYKIVG